MELAFLSMTRNENCGVRLGWITTVPISISQAYSKMGKWLCLEMHSFVERNASREWSGTTLKSLNSIGIGNVPMMAGRPGTHSGKFIIRERRSKGTNTVS